MKASLLLSISLFCLSSSALPAQNQQELGCPNCPQYDAFMKQGKAFFEKGIFDQALTEFQAAQVAARICDCNSTAPAKYILKVFEGIQQQKKAAIAAQKQAEKAEKNAKEDKENAIIARRKAIKSDSATRIALAQADSAKTQAITALQKAIASDSLTKIALAQADSAKTKAIIALQKADKLINAFYFYGGRFALAYGEKNIQTPFYFIDKNGDEVPKLGRWKKAEQFDFRGFAKVKKQDEENFLLDTIGNAYPVAYDIKDLKPEIRALDLSEKELTEIPAEVFQHQQLEILLLNNNSLYSLPEQIGGLKNLTSLDLSTNQLTILPEQIGELINLASLKLNNNSLASPLEQIGDLKNLTNLELHNTHLMNLPEQIGELKNLTYLVLDFNQLTSLPEQIGELKNLTYLNLFENQLTSLPEQIGELKQLGYLELGGNQLTSLPEQIGELKHLSYLALSGNRLTSLPEQIGELKHLSYLELSLNQLTSLPEQIGELKHLSYLGLGFNLFTDDMEKQLKQLLPNCTIREYDELTSQKYFYEKNYTKAYDYIKKALGKDSTNYNHWFSLSFYALFVNQPQEAISAAKKTLEINPVAQGVESNLALGYLLNNQWSEAEKIYLKWKGQKFPDDERLCDEVFLQDIQDLEAAGITHPDFEKAKQLFGK